MGDSRDITVMVSLGNDSEAGVKQDKIIILTSKPERLEVPLFVTVPETNAWGIVSDANLSRNVSLGEAGLLSHVVVNNSGNVQIIGRLTVVDLGSLLWMDESNFTLMPGERLERPLYFFVPNGTLPGTYQSNISFFDSLNNARRMNITLFLADVHEPRINLTLSQHSLLPNEKLQISAVVSDNVNVSRVWGGIDGSALFNLSREGDVWVYELKNLTPGNHTLNIWANDTAGNIGRAQDTFSVSRFDYLVSQQGLNYYRFKPNQPRSLSMMRASPPVQVNITLKSLTWTNQENNSLNVSVLGEAMTQGSSRTFMLSGDLMVSIVASNYTEFTGAFEVTTPAEVANPNPLIAFSGTVGDYDATPPLVMVVAGVKVECNPQDVGVYENSSYVCSTKYPIDTNSSELSVTIPKKSYDALINGFETQVSSVTAQRNSAQGMNWVLFFVILISIAAYLGKTFVWDKVHFKFK